MGARLDETFNALGLISGHVYPNFAHHFDHHRIELARFDARALPAELLAAALVQERFRHLAARAIVDTNKEDFLLHGLAWVWQAPGSNSSGGGVLVQQPATCTQRQAPTAR